MAKYMKACAVFKVEIRMNNAAFEDESAGHELYRILTHLAQGLDGDSLEELKDYDINLRDINGNTVGFAKTIKRR